MKQKKERKKIKLIDAISPKRLKNGTYSMTSAVIMIVGAVLVNLVVGQLPSSYTQIDVSEEKLYTISEDTKKVLDQLEEDVTLYLVVQSGREDDTIQKLLERYGDASSHIHVETKDPIVNPGFVSEYTKDNLNNNSVIVVSGDKNKIVDYSTMYESSFDYSTYSYSTTGFDGEGQLTSAISYVTSENLPVLYTITGHGESSLGTTIEESVKKDNIDIKEINLLSEGQVPEDADCIVLNSPQTDISEDEKNYILDYLETGGKALIFSDYTEEELTNFDSLLENYGVHRVEGIAMDMDSQHSIAQTPYYLLPDIQSTDITSELASSGYYVLMPMAQGIQRLDTIRDTLEITELLVTSDNSYSKTNLQDGSLQKSAEDLDGPFALGVSIKEEVSEGETQLVYFSTSNLLNEQMNQMVSGGNTKLVLAALEWMCKDENAATVSIPSKSLSVTYLTVTDYDRSYWSLMTLGIIPGAFLLLGFAIWLKRRKA